MKKYIILSFLILLKNLIYSQGFEENQIYVKTINEFSIDLIYSEKKLVNNIEDPEFKDVLSNFSIKTIEKPFKAKDDNLQHTFLVKFTIQNEMEDLLKVFDEIDFIEYAEKVPINELFFTPNDPQFTQQWNLNTIQAELAWNISTGSTQVVVAVTDNAILTTHQDLQNNIWVNPLEIANNGIDDDGNGYIDDVNGWDAADNDNNPNPVNLNNDHGTHVSGIVAATTDNSVGIAAIGFNVKIMAIKIGSSPSGSLSGAFAGIDYAISTGQADVVNMSWGGGGYSQTNQNVITAAHNAGIVLVAAAGNSNTSAPMYPASYNYVISVGATNVSDQRASFSNYGSTIDVMAPGRDILSTENNTTNNGYGLKSGTSMASPLVAGLCALMISNSPGITPTQVENCLENTCDNIDAQNPSYVGQIGAGRINAFQALQCFNTPPTAEFSVDFENPCTGQSIQFSDQSFGTTITSWLWNFGDGTPTSSLQNPTHTYTSAGPFTVTLTVVNAYGTDTEVKASFIVPGTPTAVLSGSTNIVSGGNAYLQVQFTGNPPFDFVYTDGTTNYSETGITNNPYYFSVTPSSNTTYSLVSVSDVSCLGTVNGSAVVTLISNTPVLNNALDFDGVNDYINIDAIQNDMVSASNNFTVEFWVQIDGVNSTNYGTLFASNSSAGANKIDIYYDYPTGVIKVLNTNTSNIYLTGITPVGDNLCHHIAYVFDNNTTSLYIDGNLDATNVSSLNILSSDRYSIGQEYDVGLAPSDFYEDNIDDFRIWDHSRTQQQILNNKDNELTGNETGLIAYYDFNQGTPGGNNIGVTTLEDLTPNAYDGTLSNFALTGMNSNWVNATCINQINSCSLGQYILDDSGFTLAQSIAYTDDGGFVLAGYTTVSGAGQEDVFVTKYDVQNNVEWSNTYGTSSSDKGFPIYICTTSNGFLISLQSQAYATSIGGLVVININNNGGIIWQKKIDNSSAFSDSRQVSIDNQGDYLIAGTVNFNTAGGNDAYFIKMDNTGNLLGSTTYGTSWHDHSFGVIQTEDNGYFSIGQNLTFGTGVASKLLIKMNSLGVYQWSKYYDNDNNETFYDIIKTNDGNYCIIGFEGSVGSYDPVLTKIDTSGNVIWSKKYAGVGSSFGSSLEVLQNGEMYFSGYSNAFGNGNNDAFLTKVDANGNEIWTKFYGSVGNENFYTASNNMSINEGEGKIYLFANSTTFGGSDKDPYIVITDLEGNSDCNTVDVNWIVTLETPTVGNAPGTIGTMGTMSNSNLIINPFVGDLDTLCTSLCNPAPITNCENTRLDITICLGDSIQINLPDGADYNWSPNYNISDNQIQNPVLYPTVDTSYIVFYVNADSCSVIDTINIVVNEKPTIVASPQDTTICPVNCVPLNATGANSYIWTPNTNLSNPNIANPIACPLSNTQYIVEGTNSFGCTAQDTVNINILACCGAYADFIMSDSILCIGESISIVNNSIINPIATHSWTFNGATPSSFNGQNPPNITYNTAGVFTIEYILSDACGIDTIEKTIYVFDLPYIETANDTTLCDSTTLMYNLGGITIGGYDYLWLPTVGLNDATISNPMATISASIQYVVTVTDEFSTCVNYDTVNIILENIPTDFIVANSISWCENDSITLSSSFAFDSIIWNGTINSPTFDLVVLNNTQIIAEGFLNNCSVLDTFNITVDTIPDINILTNDTSICLGENIDLEAVSNFPILWNTNETTNIINISPVVNTSYSVTVTNGSCLNSDSVSIVVNSVPQVTIVPSDTGICLGSNVILTAITTSSVLWNTGDVTSVINVSPVSDSLFYVIVSNVNCSNSDSVLISVDTIPDVDILTNDTSICLGENIDLEAVSSFPVLWNTNETTNIINVNPSIVTTYFVSAINGNCRANDSVLVTILSLPNITISGPDTVCVNSIVNLTASGGTSYLWTNADNLNGNTNSATITNDTTIYVEGLNVCSNIDSINIFIEDSNFVSISGPDTICEGESIQLIANGSGNYLWNTGATTSIINEALYTNNSFYVSSGLGYCPIASDSFDVVVYPYPILNTNGPINTQQGQTVDLEVNGATYYIWNPTNGLSCVDCENPSLIANQSIVFYITGSNDYCEATDSIEVNVSYLDECILMADAFTPNNDLVNNTFYPISKGVGSEIREFRIYNRWGENIHNELSPWDGTYKGEKQALEVYVYYVKYFCNGEEKTLMGNVTIIR